MPDPIAMTGARAEKLSWIPPGRLRIYTHIAAHMAAQGHSIHTGAAPGCDQIAAEAALQAGGRVMLFLPWPSFERDWIRTLRPHAGRVTVCIYDPEKHARWNAQVDEHYPNPETLGAAARKRLCRNGGIIAGCAEVVALPAQEGRPSGGTGYVIDLAGALGIPVWNLTEEAARVVWYQKLR